MDNCLFCKIIKGEIPSYKIYEDDEVYAFLDISQVTRGHTLVIPKKHYQDIFEIDAKTMAKVYEKVNTLANDICTKLGAKGVNILNNNKEIAGQTVFHFHVHIIPRYDENDKIVVEFNENKNIDLEGTYELLK